jgi:hypothetical protein
MVLRDLIDRASGNIEGLVYSCFISKVAQMNHVIINLLLLFMRGIR